MSIWKTPDQKPDGFKPHRILVIYEAHDEPELMFSPQYDTLTDHRYVNRWCYLDDLIAQADKAERLQKAVDLALERFDDIRRLYDKYYDKYSVIATETTEEIKQLIKD